MPSSRTRVKRIKEKTRKDTATRKYNKNHFNHDIYISKAHILQMVS